MEHLRKLCEVMLAPYSVLNLCCSHPRFGSCGSFGSCGICGITSWSSFLPELRTALRDRILACQTARGKYSLAGREGVYMRFLRNKAKTPEWLEAAPEKAGVAIKAE